MNLTASQFNYLFGEDILGFILKIWAGLIWFYVHKMSDKGSIRLTLKQSSQCAYLSSFSWAGFNIFSVTQLLRPETTPVSFIYSFQVFDSRKNWKVGKRTPKEILESWTWKIWNYWSQLQT